jgi:hypothetical protein
VSQDFASFPIKAIYVKTSFSTLCHLMVQKLDVTRHLELESDKNFTGVVLLPQL